MQKGLIHGTTASLELKDKIRSWCQELGFDAVGVVSAEDDFTLPRQRLESWLGKGYQGSMSFMRRHQALRSHPAKLMPSVRSIIVVRMQYIQTRPANEPYPVGDAGRAHFAHNLSQQANIARYALGADYHRLMRKRLQRLGQRISDYGRSLQQRPFVDSAPVMEVELAQRAGLGWRGKHTLLLSREAGSWFFLGSLFTSLDLVADLPSTDHCGTCRTCLDICPTQALVAPYALDARKCISYLTIEHKDPIDPALRPAIGNRVYGCDDCQLLCPWNRDPPTTREEAFQVRHGLDTQSILALWAWDPPTFNHRLQGSAIYRIGWAQWMRNLAIGLGNAAYSPTIIDCLLYTSPSPRDRTRSRMPSSA